MKNLLKTVLLILSLSALAACAGADDAPSGSVKMVATVTEVGDRLHVDVVESEYTSGVHIVLVSEQTELYGRNGKSISLDEIKVGDRVEILYSGQVMLSYPPQIAAARITLK